MFVMMVWTLNPFKRPICSDLKACALDYLLGNRVMLKVHLNPGTAPDQLPRSSDPGGHADTLNIFGNDIQNPMNVSGEKTWLKSSFTGWGQRNVQITIRHPVQITAVLPSTYSS
jgi:hypothetical protein